MWRVKRNSPISTRLKMSSFWSTTFPVFLLHKSISKREGLSGKTFLLKMPTDLERTVSTMIKYLRPAILLFSFSSHILFQLSSSPLQKKRTISVSFASPCVSWKWSIGNPRRDTVVDLQGRNLQVCFKGEVNAPYTAWGFLSSILNKEHALLLPCQCQMNLLNKEIGSPIISSLRSFFQQLYLTVFHLVSQWLMNDYR